MGVRERNARPKETGRSGRARLRGLLPPEGAGPAPAALSLAATYLGGRLSPLPPGVGLFGGDGVETASPLLVETFRHRPRQVGAGCPGVGAVAGGRRAGASVAGAVASRPGQGSAQPPSLEGACRRFGSSVVRGRGTVSPEAEQLLSV